MKGVEWKNWGIADEGAMIDPRGSLLESFEGNLLKYTPDELEKLEPGEVVWCHGHDCKWWPCRVQQVYAYTEAMVSNYGLDHHRFKNLGSQRVLATFEGSSQVDTADCLLLHYTHTCTHTRVHKHAARRKSPIRRGSMSWAATKWPGP